MICVIWGYLFCLLLLTTPAMAKPRPGAFSPGGAIDPHVTQATIHQTICRPGYSRAVRPSTRYTTPIKYALMAEAGLHDNPSLYELDHIIALDLGGAPRDPRNFQLQPWGGPNGARAKDRIEVLMHKVVCRGTVSLMAAQQCMAQDWHTCTALVQARKVR